MDAVGWRRYDNSIVLVHHLLFLTSSYFPFVGAVLGGWARGPSWHVNAGREKWPRQPDVLSLFLLISECVATCECILMHALIIE